MYDKNFYDSQKEISLKSAEQIIPILFSKIYRPNSVIDVGCGKGGWLHVVKTLGVTDILGIDGSYVELSDAFISSDEFRPTDLENRIQLDRRFDMAMSLEVAEHLHPSRAATFVHDLTLLSDLILFSAAQPGQTGENHINENWIEYWALLFRRHGYIAYDAVRPLISSLDMVDHVYLQNIVIFVKNSSPLKTLIPECHNAQSRPLSYILPHMYLYSARRPSDRLDMLQSDLNYYYALRHAYVNNLNIDPDSPNIKHYGTLNSIDNL